LARNIGTANTKLEQTTRTRTRERREEMIVVDTSLVLLDTRLAADATSMILMRLIDVFLFLRIEG
jgi:hypothetical protein